MNHAHRYMLSALPRQRARKAAFKQLAETKYKASAEGYSRARDELTQVLIAPQGSFPVMDPPRQSFLVVPLPQHREALDSRLCDQKVRIPLADFEYRQMAVDYDSPGREHKPCRLVWWVLEFKGVR